LLNRGKSDGTGLRSPESRGVAIYRTWRPRTFAELVGQDAVVKTLTTALDTGRLAHAYLFSGPRGSGKTSAAKILARCIECVNGPTSHPDNTCENCRAILDGTALDVLEIDAASNRGIDEIRALRDAVKFAPASMRAKVYIIDEAHMLTKEGANAFLKTLEEPPEWAVFILATTEPEKLPPTILSRCQRYAFRRIAIPTMIARMREIAGAEGITIDDGALAAIAYRADGGLRDALTMLEQVSAFASGPVDVAVVDAAFGTTAAVFARALRDATLDGDAAQALRIIDEASDGGADMPGLIRSTIAEFRHLLVARVNPELLAQDLSEADAEVAAARAASVPQARLVRALRLLSDAFGAARGSGNARLELESAVLRFTLQGEDPTLEALASRVAAIERSEPPPPAPPPARKRPPADAAASPAPLAAAPPEPTAAAPSRPAEPVRAEAAEPRPEAPAANGELSLQKLRSLWQNIRTRAEEARPSLTAPLSRATLEGLDGTTLVIRVPVPPMAEVVKRELSTLTRAIGDVTGHALTVRVVSGNAAPAAAPEPARPASGGETANGAEAGLLDYALKTLPSSP
jgi:DNA polymerase-3 subunit gamma/tau